MTKAVRTIIRYAVLIGGACVMLYPLLWLLSATFRSNREIFADTSLLPHSPTLEGWQSAFVVYGGQVHLLRAICNTYAFAIPKVVLTLCSVTLTAYGFSRFSFIGKRFLTVLLFTTLFLPQTVLYVPQFVAFHRLGWIDSPWYLPLIIPAALAGDTVFVVAVMQFIRGIPRSYDDAAKLDGCNSLQTLWYVLTPMLKPILCSCGTLQLLWTVNDYMGPLLYVKTPNRYPLSVFIKLSMDADSGFAWNRVLCICAAAMFPQIVVFFAAQRNMEPVEAASLK